MTVDTFRSDAEVIAGMEQTIQVIEARIRKIQERRQERVSVGAVTEDVEALY